MWFCFLLCRYGKILDDIQSNPEKHGGPPDGIVSAPTLVLPYQLQPKGLRYTGHHKMSFYSPWVYPPVYVEVSVNFIVGVWNWTTLVASVNSQPARQAATWVTSYIIPDQEPITQICTQGKENLKGGTDHSWSMWCCFVHTNK